MSLIDDQCNGPLYQGVKFMQCVRQGGARCLAKLVDEEVDRLESSSGSSRSFVAFKALPGVVAVRCFPASVPTMMPTINTNVGDECVAHRST